MVEWVECGVVRWCEHVTGAKKIYEYKIKVHCIRRTPLAKWTTRVDEYWSEKVAKQGIAFAEKCQNMEN